MEEAQQEDQQYDRQYDPDRIITRRFFESLCEQDRDPLVSSCIPRKCLLLNDDYSELFGDSNAILGVGYAKGDSQLCVTGKCHRGESEEAAAAREIEEEMGLKLLAKEALISVYSTSCHSQFIVHVSECRVLNDEDDCSLVRTPDARPTRQIAVYIHGDYTMLCTLVRQITRKRSDRDDTRFVSVIPLRMARVWCEYRQSRRHHIEWRHSEMSVCQGYANGQCCKNPRTCTLGWHPKCLRKFV